MNIRMASLSDVDDLQRLVSCFREVLGRNNPNDETLGGSLKKLLIGGDAEFFLIADDTFRAVGYIQQRYQYSLWLSGLEATLEDLYVSPDRRRQGMGIHLMQFAIERAKEKGCRAIKLDTNESNRSAIDLYLKLGFTSGSSRYSDTRQLMFEKNLECSC